MLLVPISPPTIDVDIDLAYGGADNFTGLPVYRRPACYLHPDASARLCRAVALSGALGLRLRLFDAFRPTEAQWLLWRHTPDKDFLADPRRGSPHSRGVALDVTLIRADGGALDMGTPFDAFSSRSHHGDTAVSIQAQQNRLCLLGLMTAAGWDFYGNEWWHYQLPESGRYPLLSDTAAATGMM